MPRPPPRTIATPTRTTVASFPPSARRDARVLLLGSMPGGASLQAGEYYAHPHNLFWPFMGALVGASPSLPYALRLTRLHDAGIALWDVLAECERAGSLDSAIRDARHNDIGTFLDAHPAVRWVLFNGAKAEAEFRRMPTFADVATRGIQLRRLPSTSPANAGQSRDAKRAAWGAALDDAGIATHGETAALSPTSA